MNTIDLNNCAKDVANSGNMGISSSSAEACDDDVRVVAVYKCKAHGTDSHAEYVELRRGKHSAIVPASLFLLPAAWHILSEQHGITVLNRAMQKRIREEVSNFSRGDAFVVDRLGWNGEHYAYGNDIISPAALNSQPAVNVVPHNPKFCTKGSLDDFWEPLIPLIKKQDLLLVSCATAFLPPILDIVASKFGAVPNPIYDWCGPPGVGKTIGAILLPGSIWGSNGSNLGFGESWYMTEGGLEEHLQRHRDSLLCLDEANTAQQGPKGPDQVIPQSIFALSDGRAKVRHSKFGSQQPDARLVVMSTSNDPISVVGSKRKAKAVSDRCITINVADNRPYGVLSHLPDGYDDAAQVMDALKCHTANSHGAPIRAFLQKLVDERHANQDKLATRIHQFTEELKQKVQDLKPDQERRFKSFALAYSAGRLARSYGALPDKPKIGALLPAFVAVWKMVSAISSDVSDIQDPISILKHYVVENRKSFKPLRAPTKMTKDEFEACPGFIKRNKSGDQELIIAVARFKKLRLGLAARKKLKQRGVLVCEATRTDNKRKLRLVKGEELLERVYVIDQSKLK